MLRIDREIDCVNRDNLGGYEIKDWPTFHNNKKIQFITFLWRDRIIELSQILQRIPILKRLVDPVYGLYNRKNRERYIKMGIEFLNKYDEITTTRLHGLILGVLMGKKVIIYDNKYNKCSNFYNTWLIDFDLIQCKND